MYRVRHRSRRLFQSLLPLAALVWITMPLHHCNQALAGASQGASTSQEHCGGCPPDGASSTVSSCDAANVAPAPAKATTVVDAVFVCVFVSVTIAASDGAQYAPHRPWYETPRDPVPIHLRKSVFLI
jgi:hypothetical protein